MGGRGGLATPTPSWLLGVAPRSLHHLLSIVEATAFVLGKLAEARGKAAPWESGSSAELGRFRQRGWEDAGS